jgi:Ca2+-binding EF-hand superfamily protein
MDDCLCRLERQKKIQPFTSKNIEKVLGSRECKEEFSETLGISNLTLSELKEIFNLFDSSSRTYLTQEDFDRSYRNVGLSSSMFSTRQKSVDFHKFISMVQTEFERSWTHPKQTVVRALMYFRKQNNNFVDRKTLEILLNTYGEHWNEEFTRNVLDAVGIKHRLTVDMVENIYDVKKRGINEIFKIKTKIA